MGKHEDKTAAAPEERIGAKLFAQIVRPERDGYTPNGLPPVDEDVYSEEDVSELQKPALVA